MIRSAILPSTRFFYKPCFNRVLVEAIHIPEVLFVRYYSRIEPISSEVSGLVVHFLPGWYPKAAYDSSSNRSN
jgi:hypothetical protein